MELDDAQRGDIGQAITADFDRQIQLRWRRSTPLVR
jgi:hypothetical protein